MALRSMESSELIHVITDAVRDPRVDPDKLSKLLDVHDRIVADQRKVAFFEALARVAIKMPEIGKHGKSHHGKYARLIDIDRIIRPIISEEGFALIWDQPAEAAGNKIRVSGRLLHSGGHSESRQIDLPIDNSGSKNGAQAVISTVSYGKRAIVKMFFNLMEADEDDDGNGGSGTIKESQIRDIESLLDELKFNRDRFLRFMKVAQVEEILQKDWEKAMNAFDIQRIALADAAAGRKK